MLYFRIGKLQGDFPVKSCEFEGGDDIDPGSNRHIRFNHYFPGGRK